MMPDSRHAAALALAAPVLLAFALPGTSRAQSGAVDGTIALDGTAPSPRTLKVTSDQGYCGDTLKARDLLVHGGRVENAVVWIEGAEGKTGNQRRVLANSTCRFTPRVLAAAVSDTLVVANRDSLLHNTNLEITFTRGELSGLSRTVGNFSLPVPGMTIEKPQLLRRPGLIEVNCDAHSWMKAWIRVFDHPYFAVTGPEGRFSIEGLPPGTYTLKVRHERLGELEQSVTVKPGESTTARLSFST